MNHTIFLTIVDAKAKFPTQRKKSYSLREHKKERNKKYKRPFQWTISLAPDNGGVYIRARRTCAEWCSMMHRVLGLRAKWVSGKHTHTLFSPLIRAHVSREIMPTLLLSFSASPALVKRYVQTTERTRASSGKKSARARASELKST